MYQRLIGACAAFLMALGAAQPALASQSVYVSAPDEPGAIRVVGAGDGRADDSAALQQAIDKAAEKGGGGIVFLPEAPTASAVRSISGRACASSASAQNGPSFCWAANTPGFQRGVAHMLIFAGGRPGRDIPSLADSSLSRRPAACPFDKDFADANPGTFYSALGNIDFRILDGQSRRRPRSASTPRSTASSAMSISTSAPGSPAFTMSPTKPRTCISAAAVTAFWPRRLRPPGRSLWSIRRSKGNATPLSASMRRG